MGLWQRGSRRQEEPAQRVISNALKFWTNLLRCCGPQMLNGLKFSSFRGFVSLFLVGMTLSVAIAACSGDGGNTNTASSPGATGTTANKEVEVTLVSFAVTKAAHDKIIPKFVEKWQKEHNQTVVFKPSYGGSGSQTRSVIDGLEADVVHLALGLDVQKIEKAGLIQAGWEKA